MTFAVHSPAPAFALPDQDGKIHSLAEQKGKWVLLYFYPKDDTPGCTTEACGFRDLMSELKKKGVVIFGVSADSPESHKKFADKFVLTFPLLSDPEKKMIQEYEAWGKKSMYGKEYMGILRSSVLIDSEGIIRKIYPKVSPEEHPAEVLKDMEEFA